MLASKAEAGQVWIGMSSGRRIKLLAREERRGVPGWALDDESPDDWVSDWQLTWFRPLSTERKEGE